MKINTKQIIYMYLINVTFQCYINFYMAVSGNFLWIVVVVFYWDIQDSSSKSYRLLVSVLLNSVVLSDF